MADLLEDEEAIAEILLQMCEKDIYATLLEPSQAEHYGVPVSISRLAARDPQLAAAVLSRPRDAAPLLAGALVRAQRLLLERLPAPAPAAPQDPPPVLSAKANVHARLHALPQAADRSFPPGRRNPLHPGIAGVGAAHLGRLVSVAGTVVRAGAVRAMEGRRLYRCARCAHVFCVRADEEAGGGFEARLPAECPSGALPASEQQERQRQQRQQQDAAGSSRRRRAGDEDAGPCLGSTFEPVPSAEAGAAAAGDISRTLAALHTSHQEVRVQEAARCLDLGAAPASLLCVLRGEMADACQPGDDVEITGIVTARWRPLIPGQPCDADVVLTASSLRVAATRARALPALAPGDDAEFRAFWAAHARRPLLGRNRILASLCPQVYGMFSVKLAVALALVGGVPAGTTVVRGEAGEEGAAAAAAGDSEGGGQEPPEGGDAPMPAASSCLSGDTAADEAAERRRRQREQQQRGGGGDGEGGAAAASARGPTATTTTATTATTTTATTAAAAAARGAATITTTSRGDVHVLLVGDPGTGKSQIMKFAARVAPRAVVTTGRGTSGAGLTAAAVREGGQWSLEAGALVLADGGLCCMDELGAVREADLAAVHEAMEQQTVHVAKAGMMATLPTRCAVLAATNPRGGAFAPPPPGGGDGGDGGDDFFAFGGGGGHGGNANRGGGDPATLMSGVSAPLLSRFDAVLALRDPRDRGWDAAVAGRVLDYHRRAGRRAARAARAAEAQEAAHEAGGAQIAAAAADAAAAAAADAGPTGRGCGGDEEGDEGDDAGMGEEEESGRAGGRGGGGGGGGGGGAEPRRRRRREIKEEKASAAAAAAAAGNESAGGDDLDAPGDGDNDDDDDDASVLPVSVLRAYVAWARGNVLVAARVRPDAALVASAFYREARQRPARPASRTTVRLLPSLMRLAQAHARLTGRGEVTRQDAVVAAMVADASMAGRGPLAGLGCGGVSGAGGESGGGGGGGGGGSSDAQHFPSDPDAEYARCEPRVLRALGLDHLVGTPLPEWVAPGA